jgi:hypothetical protein
MNSEGRLIGWSMMAMPPFSQSLLFLVSNGPFVAPFLHSTLIIISPLFFPFPFLFFSFLLLLSWSACLLAVAFHWDRSLIYTWQLSKFSDTLFDIQIAIPH